MKRNFTQKHSLKTVYLPHPSATTNFSYITIPPFFHFCDNINNSALILIAMLTNVTKQNADSEAGLRLFIRGGLALATTTTLPRRSGRGTIAGGAAAAVPTSSRCSGRNTIAVDDAITTACSAPNAGITITATSSGHSQPTATSSGHSQPTVNPRHNLDIHDAASLPVLEILGNENVLVHSSSEDDSSIFTISTTKKITSKNKKSQS